MLASLFISTEIGSVANGKKVVQTDTAPKALGPYSQAIAAAA
jgi:hypothetical protein